MVGKHTISMLYYLCERKDMSMSNYHPLLDFPSITLARQILASIKREPCLRSMAKIWSAYGLAELANLWWKIIQTTMLDIIVNSSSSANITGQVTIDRPRRRAFLDQPPTSAATRPPAPVSFFQFTLQLPRRSQHKFASAPSCSCSCRPRPAAPLSLLLAFATASAAPLLWEKKKHSPPPRLQAAKPPCEVSHHRAPIRTGGLLLSIPPPRDLAPWICAAAGECDGGAEAGAAAAAGGSLPFFRPKQSVCWTSHPCALHGPFRIRRRRRAPIGSTDRSPALPVLSIDLTVSDSCAV